MFLKLRLAPEIMAAIKLYGIWLLDFISIDDDNNGDWWFVWEEVDNKITITLTTIQQE
jgi:hypothetical protein